MKLLLLAAVALAAAALVPAVQATTAPDVYVDIHVTLTDSKIVLDKHEAPRGTAARFYIRNTGTKVHAFILGNAKRGTGVQTGFSKTLQPGKKVLLQLFLNYRGTIPYHGLKSELAKPGMKGKFTIGEEVPGSITD